MLNITLKLQDTAELKTYRISQKIEYFTNMKSLHLRISNSKKIKFVTSKHKEIITYNFKIFQDVNPKTPKIKVHIEEIMEKKHECRSSLLTKLKETQII